MNLKLEGHLTDTGIQFTLPAGARLVVDSRPNYGHYFNLREKYELADVPLLASVEGVTGLTTREFWSTLELLPGVYDFSRIDAVLDALPDGKQLYIMPLWRSYKSSDVVAPCPVGVPQYPSADSTDTKTALTGAMWEPQSVERFKRLLDHAARRYANDGRVEGIILQESSLGFNGAYEQDVAVGGSYTPELYRDALIELIQHAASLFPSAVSFLNFLKGGMGYLTDVAAAARDAGVVVAGPDILPGSTALEPIYAVIRAHSAAGGLTGNSAQHDSYDFPVQDVFEYARDNLGVRHLLFWNHRTWESSIGQTWEDAKPVIAANPWPWEGQ